MRKMYWYGRNRYASDEKLKVWEFDGKLGWKEACPISDAPMSQPGRLMRFMLPPLKSYTLNRS